MTISKKVRAELLKKVCFNFQGRMSPVQVRSPAPRKAHEIEVNGPLLRGPSSCPAENVSLMRPCRHDERPIRRSTCVARRDAEHL